MIFFKESGIALTEDIKKDIQDGIKNYKNPHAFAAAWGIPWSSFNYMLGKGGRTRKQIEWNAWPPVRRYLESIGRIRKGDTDWLVPSELRDAMKSKSPDVLTEDERAFVHLLRTLNDVGRKAVFAHVKMLSSMTDFSNAGISKNNIV